MISFNNLQYAGATLLPKRWIFAKTMPQNPHWYTLRKEWDDDQAFCKTVMLIREQGYKEMYRGRSYMMMNLNGHKYWTMGDPLNTTILINRKVTPGRSPYDAVADRYDDAFADIQSRVENREVLNRVGSVAGLRLLDIGCGTGLFLDTTEEMPGRYIGIDPSQAMLHRLLQKHPEREQDVINCRFEEFVDPDLAGFDCIVALFGTASYLHPDYVVNIPKLLLPGGRYFLMFYQPDYYPVCYERTGITVDFYQDTFALLPGQREEFGNYIIVQGQAEPEPAGAEAPPRRGETAPAAGNWQ